MSDFTCENCGGMYDQVQEYLYAGVAVCPECFDVLMAQEETTYFEGAEDPNLEGDYEEHYTVRGMTRAGKSHKARHGMRVVGKSVFILPPTLI